MNILKTFIEPPEDWDGWGYSVIAPQDFNDVAIVYVTFRYEDGRNSYI